MQTDTLMYRLFQERPRLALALAGVGESETADYRMKAIEVKQSAFRLDGVLLPPPERPDAPVIFAEAQFQRRDWFYARWLAAIFLYLYRHRTTRPWRALVIFPTPETDPGLSAPYEHLAQCGLVRRIYLKDLLDLKGLSLDLRLLRLIVMEPSATRAEARDLVCNPDPAEDRLEILDLVETILVYKFPALTREEVRVMLHLPETELTKTRFYQEVFGEGREEGREEGRRQASIEILAQLLAAKLGPPSAALRARMDSADIETLSHWCGRVLTADSLDDIFGEPH